MGKGGRREVVEWPLPSFHLAVSQLFLFLFPWSLLCSSCQSSPHLHCFSSCSGRPGLCLSPVLLSTVYTAAQLRQYPADLSYFRDLFTAQIFLSQVLTVYFKDVTQDLSLVISFGQVWFTLLRYLESVTVWINTANTFTRAFYFILYFLLTRWLPITCWA